jgi:hypothetical protein
VKVTAPLPTVVPPVVLTNVVPGVVGRFVKTTAPLPTVVPPEVFTTVVPVVDEVVEVVELELVVVPVVEVTTGLVVVVPPTGRLPVDATVSTVATPSGNPCSARLAASRLFGASVWT